MTAVPAGQSKAAEENAPVGTPGSVEEAAPLPQAPSPNAPVEEGKVRVTRKPEHKKEIPDGSGKVTVETKRSTRAPKTDVLKDVDLSALPVAVVVGEVTASINEYAGRAVLDLSLVGWVGDAPFKVLASDAADIEAALAELRKQLSK